MKTEIAKVKGSWIEVLNDCRLTAGKKPLDRPPSVDFKKRILLAEHSPIRDIRVRWNWLGIPSWIATHWSRHKFEKFIRSQRTDRTGIDRSKLPQDAPVDFTGEANVQSLIDVWRKRLCHRASPETRLYAEDFKAELRKFEPEIADVLVPNCVYRCGCPEMDSCGYYAQLKKQSGVFACDDIRLRYSVYNKIFYDGRDKDS